jgi:putative ABC transport system ATP-binding protein
MPAAIQTEELTMIYGRGATAVRAVDGVSLAIEPGEIVLVMGPSGSGKTTLLSMMGGLLQPTSGRVLLDGVDLGRLSDAERADLRARRVGFVFQAFNLLSSLTVEQNVLFPAHLAPGGVAAARPRARALLGRVGLGERRGFRPHLLSGGEQQRVAVARALVNDPAVILADEPTGNLDSKHGQEVLMILHDIARDEGRAVVVVTHDPRVEEIADRILWIEDGALRDRRREAHSWVRDPVCGMRVDEWTAQIVAEYEGRRIVFCSDRCRRRFEETPTRYLVPGRA